MCGFVSIVYQTPGHFDLDRLKYGMNAIYHRGPDEQATWIDPRGRVAFAYVRLSLVGLGNGAQPISTPDGQITMMVNGEFYDHHRIRTDLESKGCIFRTSSDSEIALYLYLMHGIEGVKYLRGEFSLVLYDQRCREFFAVRDRLGIKPLYYAQQGNAWYFGSEIKALLAIGVEPEWDLEAYATRAFIFRDRTLFKNIKSVDPGSWMLIDEGGLKSGYYWDLNFATRGEKQIAASRSESEMIAAVKKEIEHAVELRLEADVPVGTCVSGGLDSSAVLGIATALSGRPMDAFHLSFPDSPDYDESPFAKIAAQYNEAKLHTVEVSDNDLADNFSDTIWHTETPFFNMHSVAKLILCKFVKASGFKSVLTGEGADEIFGGYPHFKRDMALYDSLNQDPDAVKQLTIQINRHCRDGDSSTLRSDIAWINHQLTHGTSWLETQAALMSPLDNLYSLEFSHDYASRDGYRQFYNRLNKMMLEGRSPIHHSMYMLAKSCLPNIVLTTLGDRIEMAASIEGRPPLLDHVVVDLVCSLPSELKIKGLAEKYILREAVKDYIPNEIYTRKKHYFRAPPTSRKMQGKLYEMTFDLLTGNTMKKLPFFDANKTIAFMNRLSHASEAERSRMDYVLTEMAGLCLMQDRFAMVTK